MHDTIVARHLTVVREKQPILRGLNFAIARGKVTGLIGPSGSGKTTLMRAIVGAQHVTSGQLEVLGLTAGDKALRNRIGYVTQSPAVYGDLTVRQNLAYFAVILDCKRHEIDAVIGRVDLRPHRNQLVRTLSAGERARVSLAVALLGNAELLILDEPTVGLDPLLRLHLWALFGELAAAGTTLLISSHVMDEAELCDNLLLLRSGKVLGHDSKQALLRKTHTVSVQAAFLHLVEGSAA